MTEENTPKEASTKNTEKEVSNDNQIQKKSSDSLKDSEQKTVVSKDNSEKSITVNEGNTKEWMKYGEFSLIVFDKQVLESPKEWLTDTIINVAQYLLKKQFPSVKGLQDVLLNSNDEFVTIEAKESFVQIVNEGGNHWIVLSNARVQEKDNKCVIYDSRAMTHYDYTEDIQKAILKLMSADPINVDIVFVSQQPDPHQCGLYAVAFAHLLCAGEDPTEILLSSSGVLLRKHLMECLTKGEISRFPTGSQTIVDTYVI